MEFGSYFSNIPLNGEMHSMMCGMMLSFIDILRNNFSFHSLFSVLNLDLCFFPVNMFKAIVGSSNIWI